MSAKKSKKSPPPSVAATPAAVTSAGVSAEGAAPETGSAVAWIDSHDPKKRQIAKIVLVVVWLYVAALWLLALDQWFHWGIFGPKVPPIP